MERFFWDDRRKILPWMSTDGRRTKWHRNIAENFNRQSVWVPERYRRTDDRRTDDDIANVNDKKNKNKKAMSKLSPQHIVVYGVSEIGGGREEDEGNPRWKGFVERTDRFWRGIKR